MLTHWGRVTHICVGNLTIIGSETGLSPGWRQAIIWTNAGILLIGPLGPIFSEIQIGIQTFSYKKMHLKMSFVKWRPFCLGLNVSKVPWHRHLQTQWWQSLGPVPEQLMQVLWKVILKYYIQLIQRDFYTSPKHLIILGTTANNDYTNY